MRKKLLILLNSLFVGILVLHAQTFTTLESADNTLRGMSPDGKLFVGIDNDYYSNGYKSFLWSPGDSFFDWITDVESEDPVDNNNGSLIAVSNNRTIVGYFYDHMNERDVAGVWKDGKRIQLSLGSLENDPEKNLVSSRANCISADGKTIGGYLLKSSLGGIYNYTPCVWIYQESNDTWEITELTFPMETNPGGQVIGISGDGKVCVGRGYNESVPAIWIEGEYKTIEATGNCTSVSENGKYVIVQGNRMEAVRYDLEEDIYAPIELDYEDIYQIRSMHVTNSGIIFGTAQYYDINEYDGMVYSNRSFYFRIKSVDIDGKVYKEVADFEYFIRHMAPEVNLPEGLSFLYEDERDDIYIHAVSADGAIISGNGWIEGKGVSWVFDLKGNTFFLALASPEGLEVKITDVQEVTLEWDTSSDHLNKGLLYDLLHYRVYRDGVVIYDGEEELEETADGKYKYVDRNAPVGYRSYSIAGVHKKGTWIPPIGTNSSSLNEEEPRYESPRTENIEVVIADNFNLPFYDDFDTNSLKTNHWYTGKLPENWWGVVMFFGVEGSFALNTSIGGNKTHSVLTSRHMDARALEKVYLSYAKMVIMPTMGEKSEEGWLDVEISTDGKNWTTIKKYMLEDVENTGWQQEVLDISEWAAGELFQIRLTAEGEEDAHSTWAFDWFSITDHVEQENPLQLKGYIKDEKVNLIWTNATGNHVLSHMVSQHMDFIDCYVVPVGHDSENGEELIIANGFDGYDLHLLHGMYLNSVTAYLYGDEKSALELVVFENNKEIRRQAITSISPNSENTFILDEPVLIDSNKSLKYGLYVVKNDAMYMFQYQLTDQAVSGKSDLYSSDNGKTWTTLYENQSANARDGAWHLSATITSAPVKEIKTPDNKIVSYYLYRSEELINDGFYSHHLTHITDEKNNNACYKIMAYHADGTFSEFSNEICVTDMEDITGSYVSIGENSIDNGNVYFYPNPATDVVYVTSPVNKVSLFNLNGQLIKETQENKMKVSDLPEGVYFIKIDVTESTVITEKVMIKN